jgi:hypothetical protein
MTDSEIIDALGGTLAVARMCDIKGPSVSEWKRNGIPKPWRLYFEQLRPDIFGDPPAAPAIPIAPKPKPPKSGGAKARLVEKEAA